MLVESRDKKDSARAALSCLECRRRKQKVRSNLFCQPIATNHRVILDNNLMISATVQS